MSKVYPLTGIRVLDLTRILAGPLCTQYLGDLGAEIIKIENPKGGDDTRAWGPPFLGTESAYYLGINRNKKSICLDIKTKEGFKILKDVEMLESDLVISYYTLQFVPPKYRQKIIDMIYSKLNWGGGFFFFEKVSRYIFL